MKVRDLFEGLKQLPGGTDEKFQERRDADYVKRGGKSVPALQVNQERGARNKDEVRKSYSDDMKNMTVREGSDNKEFDKDMVRLKASRGRPELERTKAISAPYGGKSASKNLEHGFRSAIKRQYKKAVEEEEMNAYKLGYDHGNRYNAVKKNPYDETTEDHRNYVRGYAEGDSDWWEEEHRNDQRD